MAETQQPSRRRAAQAANLFDLRRIIGGLFTVWGVLLVILGATDSPAEANKAAGININLYAGIGMLVACNGQMDRASGKMRVAGARGTVSKAFEVVHMDRIMSLDADLDASLGNLTAGSAGA